MVRQDHLESLADPSVSLDQLDQHRAIAGFIKDLTEVIRPQLLVADKILEDEQKGLKPLSEKEGDPYMDISPDLNDLETPVGNTVQ